MITRASMRVEAVRRSINHFLLCSVLSKRTRQLAIHNPNSRIAELIGLACHEFMDDKSSFNRLAIPAAPIKDADMLRIRRQPGGAEMGLEWNKFLQDSRRFEVACRTARRSTNGCSTCRTRRRSRGTEPNMEDYTISWN